MTANTHHDDARDPTATDLRTLPDPEAVRERPDVAFDEETTVHDERDHCGLDLEGRAVVGVEDDDGDLLVLVNRDHSVALLPHGTVEDGDDWAVAARRGVEGQTGVSIELDRVTAVRSVEHVVDGEDDPHARTTRVVFAGSPVDGAIQDCKRSAEAGRDGWEAVWVDDLPGGVSAPEGGPSNDLDPFLA